MLRVFSIVLAFACAAFTTIACSDETPVSPTPSTTAQGQAVGADGSTLKVSAPNPVSPDDGATLNTLRPTLEVTSAAAQYAGRAMPYSYDFELQTASGTVVRAETLPGTTWAFPDNLANDTSYQWRARAVRNNAFGPWSALRQFRTQNLVGCENGVMVDMRAYFFSLIGRSEGQSAHDWVAVMRASGIPAGPTAGVRLPGNAPFYGLTQQIDSGGGLRGRVFLPTSTPNPHGYFIQDVDFLSDAGGSSWAWRPHGTPAYAPRACP
jgi:hypothetical protein